ncbi:hypothetical protein EJ110_NYTH36596 [Nymphaea thermarum]|nr:hypothetical protein EJ110_NYTH36596 [Nymphaea thermarum]
MKSDSIAESPKVACRDNAESTETEEKGGGLCFSCGSAASSLPPKQKLVVGYALKPNKIKSFLQPRLEALARITVRGNIL